VRQFLQILEEYWRLHPVEATHAGIRRFDARLADFSAAGLAERQAWLQHSQAVLEGMDPAGLSTDEQIDRRVLLGELAGQVILEEWRWTARAPALYVEHAMQGLHYLLARPDLHAPPAERDAHFAERLGSVARVLSQGRANLNGQLVAPEFAEIALVACQGADWFLDSLPPGDGTTAARQAVADFAVFVREELNPRGSFALGPELFARLLRDKHGLDLTADDVHRHGQDLAAALLAELETFPRWSEQVEALKADHPTRATLLQTYADEAARARAFVETQHLVPIPPGERFEVRPTAPFLRATTPLGHFDRTPPFAPDDNLGILYITPIESSLPLARQEELLAAHCHTAIRAICLHETFPGHHVQLWHAKLRGSAVRRQFSSTLFSEGWALYCEELMEEAGFYDTPGLKLWRLKNAMWRAVRLMVDVDLHCRGRGLEAAARPLVDLGVLEPNTARGEALRYTTSPTQPSSYVLGRDRIVELRTIAEQRADFDLAGFHDWLLGFSSISPAFIPEPVQGVREGA
jgi:uncharacterized protein (DUF885 family)